MRFSLWRHSDALLISNIEDFEMSEIQILVILPAVISIRYGCSRTTKKDRKSNIE